MITEILERQNCYELQKPIRMSLITVTFSPLVHEKKLFHQST